MHEHLSGCDGLTADFYKVFWPKFKNSLYDYYKLVYQARTLGWSARKGVLSLTPKKGKDPQEIKNWRPITLLNMDYKILSKILAQRLQKVLPYIVSSRQTGFMKGWNKRENIRKTVEITTKMKKDDLQAIIFAIDFQKCFDLCKHEALLGSLKYFGIHSNFVKWVDLLLTGFSLCVQNNGYCSNFQPQTRGLHQECCYSPLGFLLCGEIFSLILYSADLEGIKYKGLINLLLQFADNSNLFLKAKDGVLDKVAQTLDHIEGHMGLKVNYDKSTVYRIGSLENSKATLYCK